MIHKSVTQELIRDWAGTAADVTYYEYEITDDATSRGKRRPTP